MESPQLHIWVIVVVRLIHQGKQTLDHVERVIVLVQGEKGIWAAALLRRRGTSATNTNGIVLAWR